MREVDGFISSKNLTPPLMLEELDQLAREFIEEKNYPASWHNWTMVILNNSLWRPIVEAVPHEKRVLLLPQCLRNSQVCPAPIDEFGLLCQGCGSCVISDLLDESDELGMMSIVAEGSTFVAELIENSGVEAIIGVSCLSGLEKAFRYMLKNAVPGLAIPLNCHGCKDTEVDTEILREAFEKQSKNSAPELNLKKLLEEVRGWFSPEEVERLIGPVQNKTDQLGRDWLMRDGKRYRPFLTAAVARSLGASLKEDAIKKLALATECFHKASLIHDDIEDQDSLRYGQPTFHEEWGVPLALNTGDLLLGLGYRLISQASLDPTVKISLLEMASEGHLALCYGQGEELYWHRHPSELTLEEILNIFKGKTAPAFEVALMFGAIYAGADQETFQVLHHFSENLGIAYQIRDDLEDYSKDTGGEIKRLSIINTLPVEEGGKDPLKKGLALYEHYRTETLRVLKPLKNTGLKSLLYRVTARILQDLR